MRWLILTALLASGCATRSGATHSLDLGVESWLLIDPTPMNETIETGIADGAIWPTSPLRITVELFGDDADTRHVSLVEEANRGEAADMIIVTIVRDGFLDDSVRGSWHRVTYHRQPDGTWRVDEVRRAFRCWRGNNLEKFRSQLCP